MKNLIKSVLPVLLVSTVFSAYSASNSSSLLQGMEKLKVLGSVLYVAAHPDDENTGMITYFANERKMKTTYLSLTRGDGGQNLIGPEKFQWLGLIRTQELLEARKIDGGEQAFSRAYDFGYSKTPEETMNIWDGDTILSDVVWVIRKLKPDIIVTRFSPDLGRRTHGHHTASAILAGKAIDLAGDKNAFPDQLKWVEPWQPKRIFFNTSWWFYGTRDFDKTGLVQLETGQYNPLLGKSYGEISAESRSMHKSQGFGVMKERGSDLEYLRPYDALVKVSDPFQDINTSWTRVNGGEEIGQAIDRMIAAFDDRNPQNSVRDLLAIRGKINNIDDDFWKLQKLKEVDQLILGCLGIWQEAFFDKAEVVPGSSIPVSLSAIYRAGEKVYLKSISCQALGFETVLNQELSRNTPFVIDDTLVIPGDLSYTVPYWLENPVEGGRFVVNDRHNIGKAENDPEIPFAFVFEVSGTEISIEEKAIHKWRDRVNGEMQREVVVVPPVVACFKDKNLLFPDQESRNVQVLLSAKQQVKGVKVNLELGKGWKSEPSEYVLDLDEGEERRVEFTVTPPKSGQVISAGIQINTGGESHSLCQVRIDHPHIKSLTAVMDNHIDFVRKDIINTAELVGYVDGAGDEIPQALEQLGSEVMFLNEEDFFDGSLDDLDAIVLGVRAYNTVEWLPNVQDKLMEFVEKGGNVVVQYNVSYGLITDEIGPYPLTLSRDRVTDENARVTLLNPSSNVLTTPNKIGMEDFDGWVQERGLYFPNEWDEKYEPLISWHDPEEDDTRGALLVTNYGKGTFTYTGISWFRQLPAGVGGAYKIFANLISAQNGS